VPQRIFITGATGLLGAAIAADLARRREVRALSRNEQGDAAIAALGATPVRGDLQSIEAEQLGGYDAVIHCAGFTKPWGTRRQFWMTNVEGTSRLLDAARRAGVQRFIHMGTEAVVFRGQHLWRIDEDYPYPRATPFLYSETKAAAERAVLAANAPGFHTISLRPCFVWGPGELATPPALDSRVRTGRFMWLDGGCARTSTTHIANLIHAVNLALERGRCGAAYFIADDGDTSLREFLTSLLATRGLSPPQKSMSGTLARGLAAFVELGWRAAGRRSEPPLTRFAACLLSRDCTVRTDRAKRELGYAPVISREEGLKQLLQARLD
jgi:nucleoside-diphosphate-sugar epimerase